MLNYPLLRNTLVSWGDKFTQKLKNYFRTEGFKATGETIDQIKPVVSSEGDNFKLEFESKAKQGRTKLYTISDVINKGRKKNSPIDDRPPYKDIEQWIIAKGVTLRDQKSGKFTTKSELNVTRAAIAISRSINKEGTIKRKNYTGANMYESLFVPEQENMKLEIANAHREDVRAYMKRQNKNIK